MKRKAFDVCNRKIQKIEDRKLWSVKISNRLIAKWSTNPIFFGKDIVDQLFQNSYSDEQKMKMQWIVRGSDLYLHEDDAWTSKILLHGLYRVGIFIAREAPRKPGRLSYNVLQKLRTDLPSYIQGNEIFLNNILRYFHIGTLMNLRCLSRQFSRAAEIQLQQIQKSISYSANDMQSAKKWMQLCVNPFRGDLKNVIRWLCEPNQRVQLSEFCLRSIGIIFKNCRNVEITQDWEQVIPILPDGALHRVWPYRISFIGGYYSSWVLGDGEMGLVQHDGTVEIRNSGDIRHSLLRGLRKHFNRKYRKYRLCWKK